MTKSASGKRFIGVSFSSGLKASLLFACATHALATSAQAQESGATVVEDDRQFEVIIVTAQKREEALQDVPLAVSAYNGKVLADAGVKDIKELSILSPSLMVTSTQNEALTTARIRGVGTVGDNAGLESSVGVTIDGVYRPRNGVSFNDLGELERVEVLRGPQGTLFGKNTSAGVISITTAQPKFKWETSGEATVSNYDGRGLSASITGPLIDGVLAFRLYGAHRERDGYLDVNVGDGPRVTTTDSDQNLDTLRGQLTWLISDTADFRLIADYTKRDENCCGATHILVGPTSGFIDALTTNGAGIGKVSTSNRTAATPFNRLAYMNRNSTQEIEERGISGELNWDLGFGQLTSITAKRKWELAFGQDIDYSGADILYRPDDGTNGNAFETFSQEVRLAGESGPVSWLVGGIYIDEDLTSRARVLIGDDYAGFMSLRLSSGTNVNTVAGLFAGMGGTGPAFTTGGGQTDLYTQNAKSFALFTQETAALTDRLEATIGVRYTREEKDVTSVYSSAGNGFCARALTTSGQTFLATALGGAANAGQAITLGCIPNINIAFSNITKKQTSEEEAITGTLKLAYRFSEGLNSYISYARGYKGGGFNLDREVQGTVPVTPDLNTGFKPEFVNSYEGGLKALLFDRSLIVNTALYYQEFENFQLNSFTGVSFLVTSVSGVKVKGVELEYAWLPKLSGVTLNGAVSYNESRYNDVLGNTGAALTNITLPGNTLSFAPRWTITQQLSYEKLVADDHRFKASLTGRWLSSYNTGSDLLPTKVQESYALVNGRLAYGAANSAWTLELWGNNLLDQDYLQVAINAPLQGSASPIAASDSQTYVGFLGAPRTFGLTLRLKH